jgi:hypothetical protein
MNRVRKEMKIIVTIGELIDNDLWEEYCNITGAFLYAVNEGMRERTDEVALPDELANKFMKRVGMK